MKHTLPSMRKPAILVAVALLACAALVACGGSNDHGNPVTGGPGQVDPVDAFFALVQGQVSLAAETTGEPISIDSVTATSNEDKEPVVLP